MSREEAIDKAHSITRATGKTAVVYRKRLPTLYSETEPPVERWAYVAGSAHEEKPTKPAGLRLWMWVSVTGLERLAREGE